MALVDKLRDEIIESQKAQASFTRWKILLVTIFGAAGLGVLPYGRFSEGSLALLALLPLVCLYVDALCYHSGIRVMVIARYLRGSDSSEDQQPATDGSDYNTTDLVAARDYENYVVSTRDRFNMEGFALLWVSRFVSVAVAIVAGVAWILPLRSLNPLHLPADVAVVFRILNTCWLASTALVGFVWSDILYVRHRTRSDYLDGRETQCKEHTLLASALKRLLPRWHAYLYTVPDQRSSQEAS